MQYKVGNRIFSNKEKAKEWEEALKDSEKMSQLLKQQLAHTINSRFATIEDYAEEFIKELPEYAQMMHYYEHIYYQP